VLPARAEGTIYHWLVPDPGMSLYSDKVVKDLKRTEISAINAWRKTFGRAFDSTDLRTLRELSAAADRLWARHLKTIARLRQMTTDPLPVWPEPPSARKPGTTTQEKDELWGQEILHPYLSLPPTETGDGLLVRPGSGRLRRRHLLPSAR
jgi:hypothetical protein